MEKKTKKTDVVALIGNLDWMAMRALLVYELTNCKNEVDFLNVMEMLYNSMGTKEELEKRRKDMNLKPFSDKDKEKIENWKL